MPLKVTTRAPFQVQKVEDDKQLSFDTPFFLFLSWSKHNHFVPKQTVLVKTHRFI